MRELLRRLVHWVMWGGALVQDEHERYLSPGGRAYPVSVEPMFGSERAVVVTLGADVGIPATRVPRLVVRCGFRPREIDRTIARLLRQADALEARFTPGQERFLWDKGATDFAPQEPDEEAPPGVAPGSFPEAFELDLSEATEGVGVPHGEQVG